MDQTQNEIVMSNPEVSKFIDCGSYGLHVVSGAFQTGDNKTGWKLNMFLRNIHRLLKDCPARRADFTRVTDNTVWPLKFCTVRSVENAMVSKRAIEILSDLKNVSRN